MAKVSPVYIDTISEVGFRDVPPVYISSNYTLQLSDRGRGIDYTGTGGHIITVPTNAAVAFPNGTTISITNTCLITTISINRASGVTLYTAGSNVNGDKALAINGIATLRKISTDTWIIAGSGLMNTFVW